MSPSLADPRTPNTVVLHDATRGVWLWFQDPVAVCVAHTPAEVLPAWRTVEARVETEGLHAAGFLAYEAAPAFDPALTVRPADGFPLLWFGLYRAPTEGPAPAAESGEPVPLDWQPSVSAEAHGAAIERIKGYIAAGDTYQVNFTLRLRAAFAGDPWTLFGALVRRQEGGYAAWVSTADWAICGASPELFFTQQDGELVCRPMKGTRPRGRWSAEDRQLATALQTSAKDRAENIMIVDMVRSDLGRVAEYASVRAAPLFAVEQYPTLWQMTSTVRARSRAGLTDVLRGLFPAASITGAPKPRTMQIIAELETAPRRIYTGSVGYVAPGGRAQFNVAIRTVLVDRRRGTAEYGVGGGIVWDSVAGAEWEECLTKAAILTAPASPEFALLETMRWDPAGGWFLLADHLDRLERSAAYFGYRVDVAGIRALVMALGERLPRRPHRVRLLVPRAGPARLESQPLGPAASAWRLGVAREPVDDASPFLYHKTTHRGVYDAARAACPGHDDVLLWNARGELTEACVANVAVERGGRLVTPPVACGLLPGTYRGQLLAEGRLVEEVVRVKELKPGAKVWLLNSVRGMWPATVDG